MGRCLRRERKELEKPRQGDSHTPGRGGECRQRRPPVGSYHPRLFLPHYPHHPHQRPPPLPRAALHGRLSHQQRLLRSPLEARSTTGSPSVAKAGERSAGSGRNRVGVLGRRRAERGRCSGWDPNDANEGDRFTTIIMTISMDNDKNKHSDKRKSHTELSGLTSRHSWRPSSGPQPLQFLSSPAAHAAPSLGSSPSLSSSSCADPPGQSRPPAKCCATAG